MWDVGPYVSTANPPLSDYFIQYSQPQRTNHSGCCWKTKRTVCENVPVMTRLTVRLTRQMPLSGIYKHFPNNQLSLGTDSWHYYCS